MCIRDRSSFGINAGIASDGQVQFGGSTAFSVNVGAASGGNATATSTATGINTADYNLNSASGVGGAFAAFTGTSAETVVFQNAGSATTVSLNSTNAATLDGALSTLNSALNSSGIYAVKAANGTDISFQSANTFSVNETAIALSLIHI